MDCSLKQATSMESSTQQQKNYVDHAPQKASSYQNHSMFSSLCFQYADQWINFYSTRCKNTVIDNIPFLCHSAHGISLPLNSLTLLHDCIFYHAYLFSIIIRSSFLNSNIGEMHIWCLKVKDFHQLSLWKGNKLNVSYTKLGGEG